MIHRYNDFTTFMQLPEPHTLVLPRTYVGLGMQDLRVFTRLETPCDVRVSEFVAETVRTPAAVIDLVS